LVLDKKASGQDADLGEVLERYRRRLGSIELYIEAYRRYCWPVRGVDDYRIAPFHILATEGRVWNDAGHIIHLSAIDRYITGYDEIFASTDHIEIDLYDESNIAEGVKWWLDATASGSEGIVVKPLDFAARDSRGKLLQPAVKCRGREYLRIIYGPEYMDGNHPERLKKRSLHQKRRLALAEFALGMESLERFVKREPLYRVHESVFAILALESEPADPRL
jgi:protein phosphatase